MFKTEKQFCNYLKKRIFLLDEIIVKENDKYIIEYYEELNLGYGIPDLVIASRFKENRPRLNQINLHDIIILRIVEDNKEIDVYDVCDMTKISPTQIKKSIISLTENKFITQKKDKLIIKNRYKMMTKEIYAFELKLRDWKRALFQAIRYQNFAGFSYVILDFDYLGPAKKNVEIFKKFNIGLVGIKKNEGIVVVYKPTKGIAYDVSTKMLLNEHITYHSLPSRNVYHGSR